MYHMRIPYNKINQKKMPFGSSRFPGCEFRDEKDYNEYVAALDKATEKKKKEDAKKQEEETQKRLFLQIDALTKKLDSVSKKVGSVTKKLDSLTKMVEDVNMKLDSLAQRPYPSRGISIG